MSGNNTCSPPRWAEAWRAPPGSRRVRPSCCRAILPCRVHPAGAGRRPGAGRLAGGASARVVAVPSFHVVFPPPVPAAEIAFQNKRAVYAILFHAAAEALRDIAADPRHLGAEIGAVAVLHTWG